MYLGNSIVLSADDSPPTKKTITNKGLGPRKGPPPLKQHIHPIKVVSRHVPPAIKLLPGYSSPKQRILTEEEIQQRVESLSRPMKDRSEIETLPPKLCTDCPELSFSCVKEIQETSTPGIYEFQSIPTSVSKLKIDICAITIDDDWETGGRQAFQDLISTRKDIFIKEDHLSISERDRRLFSPLFAKLDYKKTSQQVMEYVNFMNRYCVGFMCLVLDMRLQLLGTLDMHVGNFIPGIHICPPSSLRYDHSMLRKHASLLEIDFSLLPESTFAIIPVIYDQAGQTLPQLGLKLNLMSSDSSSNEWSALSSDMKDFIVYRDIRDKIAALPLNHGVRLFK